MYMPAEAPLLDFAWYVSKDKASWKTQSTNYFAKIQKEQGLTLRRAAKVQVREVTFNTSSSD